MPKKKVTEAVEEVVQEPVVSEPVPPQAPRRQGSDDLLELNDLERGVTREDSEDAKWGYLAGAARRQQILTGIVSSGIIQTENGLPVCPVDFEGLRILIPIREMVLTEWPEEDPIPRSVRIQIGRMLGATIDFIPAAVDIRNRAAVGSRKAAMLQRQKRYYATGRVKPGILMACRVLGVGNNTMTVEACGVDTEIYARNVSWEWFSDIADLHSTGDLVVARVMDVSYNEERDVYSVNLSIKEASENPDRAALEKITPNSNYFGVVTGVKDRVFSAEEQRFIGTSTWKATVAWTAKEAIFKCAGKEGVDFSSDLRLDLHTLADGAKASRYQAEAFGTSYDVHSFSSGNRILSVTSNKQ